MLHHSENEVRDGGDGLVIKVLWSSCFHGEANGRTYGVDASSRVVSKSKLCEERVPDLPAYIEFAVHLKSKSCRISSPLSLPCISSNTVETNDAFAVPLRYTKWHINDVQDRRKG